MQGVFRHTCSPRFLSLLSLGKPHPRWAESNFRDGDPNEKWHSRATKCVPLTKRNGQSSDRVDEHASRNGRAVPSLLNPIKTEPTPDGSPHLYRFSPSPGPSMRYHTFQTDVRGSTYDEQRLSYNSPNGSSMGYGSPTQSHYHPSQTTGSASSTYSDGGGGGNYPLSANEDSPSYGDHFSSNGSTPQGFCPCRTSPATGVAYISLSQQLQTSLNALRQYSHHPPNTQCLLYRRIVELNSLMQCVAFVRMLSSFFIKFDF